MLSYIAHIPHSPLLIKQISKDKHKDFKKTVEGIQKISHDLYSKNIDSIITITPRGNGFEHAHVINFSPEFELSFSPFGNYDSYPQFNGDSVIAYKLRHNLCADYLISSITSEILDTASAVAMLSLELGSKITVVPVTHSLDEPSKHYSLGKAIRDILENIQKRIAIIGLGDLSNSKKNKQKTKQNDKDLIKKLHEKDIDSLLSYKDNQIDSLFMCALRPLAVLLGALDEINYDTDILEYEQKYGIGLMTARFIF